MIAFLSGARAALSFLDRNWWLSLVAIICMQAAVIHVRSGQLADLREWRDGVAQATRDAAHRPLLAVDGVEQQIRDLGNGLDQVQFALAHARAEALAAKINTERADEVRRKEADNALVPILEKAHRAGDAYARARPGGVQREAGRAAPVDRRDDARADLPGAAGATGLADGPGSGSALVSIPRDAFDTCTTLKVRLDNGHAWAIGGGQ